MCSTPKMPSTNTETTKEEQVAAPTYADAQVTKTTAATRNKTAALAGRDIKTSPRGLTSDNVTTKKNLLGA